MKDLLRFDTIVASIALLMSCVTAGAMVYQTRVLQDAYSASVWPYLGVEQDFDTNYVRVQLVNQGVGPALIRSAQLVVDGKPLDGWNSAFFKTVFGDTFKGAKHVQIADSSVDASTAIRAGDSMQLIAVKSPQPGVSQAALRHDVRLRFCYCSINGRCWTLDSSGRSNVPSVPVAVGACSQHYSISAPSDVFAALKH